MAEVAPQVPSKASHLWWGPIASAGQAREIIAWTAWSLLLLGLAPIAAVAEALWRGEISLAWPIWENFGQNRMVLGQVAFAVIVMGAAASLLRTKSWFSAVILMGACVFVIVIVAATLLRVSAGDSGGGTALRDAILLVALGFFLRLIWRAMAAAQAIGRLSLSEHFV